MELDECIEKRASYRSYNDKKVAWEDLVAILNAARLAPSSGNLQNWSFIIIQKPELKEEIAKSALNQNWMIQAPVLIVVCSRLENIKRHYGERGEMLYSIQNCASAVNNILLKATDLGIASCWINSFDEDVIKRILKVPLGVRPQAIVTLGYSNEKIEKLKRYELDLLIHFDEWNGKKSEGLFPLKQHKQGIQEDISNTAEQGKSFFSKLISKFIKKK
jgi:nitroreductase